MPKKVPSGASVAYLGPEYPDVVNMGGPGFYEITNDEHENPRFGKKVAWVKNTPDKEGEPPNQKNNEGHWVYDEGGE